MDETAILIEMAELLNTCLKSLILIEKSIINLSVEKSSKTNGN